MTKNQNKNGIPLHTPEDFEGMRKAGHLAASLLDYITPFVQEGVSTGHLDTLCAEFVAEHGAIAAPLNYRGQPGFPNFPRSICTSINRVVCHGIPDDACLLKKGDIVNIDVTVILDGWYGDTSRMFYVGKPSIKAKKLTEATYHCMMAGIEQVKPGATLGDVGHAMEIYAKEQGYSTVHDFCGHGIGRVFHGQPSVLNYGKPGQGVVLEPGMFFTVEPMVNIGKKEVKHDPVTGRNGKGAPVKGWVNSEGTLAEGAPHDGWTIITQDGKLSAQFEHTIAVTETGYEIFTLSPKGYTFPPYD